MPFFELPCFGCLGDSHQAPQLYAWKLADFSGQLFNLLAVNAAFAVFMADIYLNADIYCRQVFRALFIDTTCVFEAGQRVYPGKIFCDRACFITLHPANKMPGEWQILQSLDFFNSLLQVVFAKITLAGLEGCFNICSRSWFC